MSAETRQFYEFENFRLDPNEKTLFRDDKPVALTPKVFETLQVFVEHAGRLLGKNELMERIWRDQFVAESNLTFNIKMLRRILNDDAHQPRFIETVPRRGYRFIAKVNHRLEAGSPETGFPKPAVPVPAAKQSHFAIVALALLLAGALGVSLILALRKQNAATLSPPILSTPFKSEKFATGGAVRAVITPDGKYVAYTSETGGKESIWLRQVATSENIQIVPPTDEQYLGLAISHDGNSLYFVRRTLANPSTSAIYRVMTFGGIPVKVVDRTEGTVSLSPDDKQLSFMRCNYQDDDFCSLMVIDADGQNERKVLTRQRPIRLSGAQFSPDGKSIAFASGQSWNGGSDFRLMRIDLASAAENLVSQKTFFEITNLKWLPDGDGMLLAAKETHDGRLRIWHVSTTTGELRALTKDATDYISLSLDKAADKMIATHVSNTFQLYFASMDNVSNPRSLGAARIGVAFAPDGKLIYEGNDGDIWTINWTGGERRQLTSNSSSDIYPRASPDGRTIFFTSNRSGSNQVWRMNADGSNQIQLTKKEGGYPRFVSPDGKWVYFASGLHQNLWRVSADGGEEIQVSLPSLSFSSDGKFVAHFSSEKEGGKRIRLAIMSVDEQKVVRTYQLAAGGPHPIGIERTSGWTSDNQSFFYITTDGSRNHLWRQALDAENPQLIGDLGNEDIVQLAVAPDGLTFAVIRGRWIHEAVIIEGLK